MMSPENKKVKKIQDLAELSNYERIRIGANQLQPKDYLMSIRDRVIAEFNKRNTKISDRSKKSSD